MGALFYDYNQTTDYINTTRKRKWHIFSLQNPCPKGIPTK